jgi:hypothetical protein
MIEPIKELPIAPSLLQGVQVLTDKVNELVDAVNSLQGLVLSQQGLIELNREMLETPPEGHNFSREGFTQGTDPEPMTITGKEDYTIPPGEKKYLTAEGWRAYDGSKWV